MAPALCHPTQELEGANIFDLVEAGSHDRLRRLMEENLGAVSKEAIASALRFQGTTCGDLFARCEKSKASGDAGGYGAAGGLMRSSSTSGRRGRSGSGSGSALGNIGNGNSNGEGNGMLDPDGSTDENEGEAAQPTRAECTLKNGSTSVGGPGGGALSPRNARLGGGVKDVNTDGNVRKMKPLPPLGPAVFSSRGRDANVGDGVVAIPGGTPASTAVKQGAAGGGAAGVGVRTYDLAAELSGGVGGGTVTSVDRELQSKINAFTNNRKVGGVCVATERPGGGVKRKLVARLPLRSPPRHPWSVVECSAVSSGEQGTATVGLFFVWIIAQHPCEVS